MRRLLSELNHFSEATTVHGFAYLSTGQKKSTRLIWSLIVLGAALVAGYFLYSTIKGFDENYTSTTIKTRSIRDFPFPAVTFHPGDFNIKEAFLRIFLNQFEFTRYNKNENMRDNALFVEKFGWLVGSMNNEIFRGVQDYLLEEKKEKEEKSFIGKKSAIFEDEICSLIALKLKNKTINETVIDKFGENMYKYNGFLNVKKFLETIMAQELNKLKDQYNISNSEVSSACKDQKVCAFIWVGLENICNVCCFSGFEFEYRNEGTISLIFISFYTRWLRH